MATFNIDDFFSLKIDQKLIDSYVPPDLSKIVIKGRSRHAGVPKTNAVDLQNEYSEHKKDCTRLICSLCKKVGEYNTKNLLASKKKLN